MQGPWMGRGPGGPGPGGGRGGRPQGPFGRHDGGHRFGHGEGRVPGWGGPFAGRGGPFGGRGGPRFGHGPHVGRGDVRAATLSLLAEGPLNGYQIIQKIGERSGGVWRPSSGSVYPGLQLLEDEGLIQAEEAEGRRVFRLTDAGRAYVQEHQAELTRVWEAVAGSVDDAALELGGLFGQVGEAVRQVAQAGSKEEIAAARQLLVDTRRGLYRILAGGPDEGRVTSNE